MPGLYDRLMAPFLEFFGSLFQAIGSGGPGKKDSAEVWRRQQLVKAQRGVFRGALRVKSGSHPGLDALWRRGEHTVTPGRIVQGRIELAITEPLRDSPRPGGPAERIYAEDDTVVYTLRTASAEIEWLLLASCAELARDALESV